MLLKKKTEIEVQAFQQSADFVSDKQYTLFAAS